MPFFLYVGSGLLSITECGSIQAITKICLDNVIYISMLTVLVTNEMSGRYNREIELKRGLINSLVRDSGHFV